MIHESAKIGILLTDGCTSMMLLCIKADWQVKIATHLTELTCYSRESIGDVLNLTSVQQTLTLKPATLLGREKRLQRRLHFLHDCWPVVLCVCLWPVNIVSLKQKHHKCTGHWLVGKKKKRNFSKWFLSSTCTFFSMFNFSNTDIWIFRLHVQSMSNKISQWMSNKPCKSPLYLVYKWGAKLFFTFCSACTIYTHTE